MVKSIEGKHIEYYEAILQLREVSDEIVQFVKKQIKKEQVHVAKVKEVINGYDYYLADNSFTRQLGQKLQHKFYGKVLLTTSLVGRKKDKDMHRFTVLFRGISFTKGDTVEFQGELYQVKGLGKEILLQQVETGKKFNVKWKNIRDVKKIIVITNP